MWRLPRHSRRWSPAVLRFVPIATKVAPARSPIHYLEGNRRWTHTIAYPVSFAAAVAMRTSNMTHAVINPITFPVIASRVGRSDLLGIVQAKECRHDQCRTDVPPAASRLARRCRSQRRKCCVTCHWCGLPRKLARPSGGADARNRIGTDSIRDRRSLHGVAADDVHRCCDHDRRYQPDVDRGERAVTSERLGGTYHARHCVRADAGPRRRNPWRHPVRLSPPRERHRDGVTANRAEHRPKGRCFPTIQLLSHLWPGYCGALLLNWPIRDDAHI